MGSKLNAGIIVLLLSTGAAIAAPNEDRLAIEDLAEPDPLVLEKTMALQTNIYLGSMELQYSQILDQLCATKHPPKRCENSAENFSNSMPNSSTPQFETPEVIRDIRLKEVIGVGQKFSAVLSVSGRQINVRKHDTIPGVGTVVRITRRQIQIFDGTQLQTFAAD